MGKDRKFTMLMTEEEKEEYEQIAAKVGFKTLSSLIRESLRAVKHKPELLFPAENDLSVKIQESVEKSEETIDNLAETLDTILDRMDRTEKFLQWTVKKLGITDREIREILKKDMSGEAIFEE